jgi:hypothetical protein
MAIEAPRLRERFELISEGYRNGMASQDRPWDRRQSVSLIGRLPPVRFTYVEEVVKEDERHRDSIPNFTADAQSRASDGKAHRATGGPEQHQFEAAHPLDDKVSHGCPEHPLHRIASGKYERQSRREAEAPLEDNREVVGDYIVRK